LRQRIHERYPDDTIVGEEFGIANGTSGRRWIIDPIDGTFSYAHGVPLFGTLIGIEIDGEPSLGVVRMPALNETVCAAKGLGCRHNGRATRCSAIATLGDALIVCGDFYACYRHGFGDAAERLQAASRERRGWGDCYGHILVATGRAEVALDPVTSIWDCAALAPILEEAGGTFTDWRGKRTIDGGNAISTNGALFDDVMTLVRASA
ncbi:MAG TPA: inositol monophosphatase family protein, partial [Candidatus Eremiobacteraceae bacterium]|nr:inositol monophosphatase family protein [Candidatus Eremiobacteraceae bacterium]